MRILDNNEIQAISGGGTGEDNYTVINWQDMMQSIADFAADVSRAVTGLIGLAYTAPAPSNASEGGIRN